MYIYIYIYIYTYVYVSIQDYYLTCEQQMYGHGIGEPHYCNKPIVHVCCVAETIEMVVVYVIHARYHIK